MRTSTAPGAPVLPRQRLGLQTRTLREWGPLGVVASGIVVLTIAGFAAPALSHGAARAAVGELALLCGSLAATAVLLVAARQREAWAGTRWVAGGLAVASGFQLAAWIERSFNGWPPLGELFAGTMSILLVVLLGTFVIDFFDHIQTGRAGLLFDVALVATLSGAAVFLLLNSGPGEPSQPVLPSTLTAVLASCAVLLVAGWGVLVMWCPTLVHLGLFASGVIMAASSIAVAHARQFGWDPASLIGPEIAAAISVLLMAGVLVLEPELNSGAPRAPRWQPWVRPTLMALGMCAAAIILVTELISSGIQLPASHSVILAVVVFGSVGGRMLLNHLEMTRVTRAMGQALEEREGAFASLREASTEVARSEARHRLLLEAAVDGIVELDGEGAVVRANDAFCQMVGLGAEDVIGRRWVDVAAMAGAGDSLAKLPENGVATLERGGAAAYLEARSSVLATHPSGTLLLIRDVTANKAAEQTIRTLFHYLQDRDEDRTRLLTRSNAAIEAERNRIARDLHDGPIQGMSAAALSLEAARMLLERGDLAEAAQMLQAIGSEIAEEAVNLRRIMSDLRPPVLEERGLIPGVRELCARLRRELRIPVSVQAAPGTEVPTEVETLAYRIVQEALTNVGKHASATQVTVRIGSGTGTLEVEVTDDGRGFDPGDGREFLRRGKVGLASMRERTELAGGTFAVRSARGAGTTIRATLPFEVLGSVPGLP